jgi:hypothetical protein
MLGVSFPSAATRRRHVVAAGGSSRVMRAVLTTVLALPVAVAPSSSGQCGELIHGHGFGANLPGKPTQFASTAADCCAFCHATPKCEWWTWNGPPPANGICYAKADNKVATHSATQVSGGVTPGPPMPPAPPVAVRLHSTKVIFVTERTYASWNIDSSCNRGFHHIHFSNPNLLAAARGLAPSRLRFGGSGNDNLVYGLSEGSPECAGVVSQGCAYTTPGCLNASHWDALYAFAQGGGADFIFGVAFGLEQACAEGPSYVWNSTNAQTLLDYLAAKKQKIWGFEFGKWVLTTSFVAQFRLGSLTPTRVSCSC